MIFLVDTNVVSETIKKRPSPRVLRWWSAQSEIVCSAVTLEELHYGVARLAPAANARLLDWLDALSGVAQIVPVDASIAAAAGQLRAQSERRGHAVTQADMLIAATALARGRVLATRNTKDFALVGVALFNPWEA